MLLRSQACLLYTSFAWKEHPMFITQDEIDAYLAGGGAYSQGRLRTVSYTHLETEKETSIPYGYEEGMTLSPEKAEKTVHFTSPPKPFKEDTLLAAMETAGNKDFDSETDKKGLGTPATRAGIIEKLVSSGYAVRKGKHLITHPSRDSRSNSTVN